MRKFIELGVPLIAFGVMGSMALAQDAKPTGADNGSQCPS